jgi:hypothetical protein
MKNKFISLKQAMALTGYSSVTLNKLSAEGLFKKYQPTKRKIFFLIEDLENFILGKRMIQEGQDND